MSILAMLVKKFEIEIQQTLRKGEITTRQEARKAYEKYTKPIELYTPAKEEEAA